MERQVGNKTGGTERKKWGKQGRREEKKQRQKKE